MPDSELAHRAHAIHRQCHQCGADACYVVIHFPIEFLPDCHAVTAELRCPGPCKWKVIHLARFSDDEVADITELLKFYPASNYPESLEIEKLLFGSPLLSGP